VFVPFLITKTASGRTTGKEAIYERSRCCIAPAVDAVAAEMAGRAKVLKLNVDENPEIAGRYSVQSIPTLLLFKGGQKVGELVGGQTTKQAIITALSEHLD